MKTLLVLSVLLCASFAAPTEDKATVPEAAVEAVKEQIVALPAPVMEEGAESEYYYNSCPDGWSRHDTHCFLFVQQPMSWYSAEEHCNGLGGHLASATNPSEYKFLQQMTSLTSQSVSWLGGFRLQEEWLWIDRQGFYYNNWFSPPSSTCSPCVNLNAVHGWGTTDCKAANRFTCSKNRFGC